MKTETVTAPWGQDFVTLACCELAKQYIHISQSEELDGQAVFVPCGTMRSDAADPSIVVLFCPFCGLRIADRDHDILEVLERWKRESHPIILTGGDPLFDEVKCRSCGCSDLNACQPTCCWAEEDLCCSCSLAPGVTCANCNAVARGPHFTELVHAGTGIVVVMGNIDGITKADIGEST